MISLYDIFYFICQELIRDIWNMNNSSAINVNNFLNVKGFLIGVERHYKKAIGYKI